MGRNVLNSEDLLDILMLQQAWEIKNMDVCDVALDICFQATDIPENRRPYVLQDIWRRIFIADKDAYWRLEDVSDEEARERLTASWICRAYAVIYHADGHKDEKMLRPQEARCTMPSSLFRERCLARSDSDDQDEAELRVQYENLIQDYERENSELDRRIREGQLLEKWQRVKMIVKEEREAAMKLESQEAMMDDVEMA
jgi:hypothetical protein